MRVILIQVMHLICMASSNPHSPKVYENNLENPQSPPNESVIRSPRQPYHYEKMSRPSTFDFTRSQKQQDMLKLKYFQQQRSNFESYRRLIPNAKVAKFLDDFMENRRDEFKLNVPFAEGDWIPITPKNIAEKSSKELQDISEQTDLDSADSEIIESKLKPTLVDRKDAHGKYIYIQPSILKNSFGLDSKTAQEILKKSAPKSSENLFHTNPDSQLEGLQKLLNDAGLFSQQQTGNSDSMQETLEGATEEQNPEDAFELAQKQAEAHLQAQHKAIASAQFRLQQEALAKIAAHNKGEINIDPEQLAKMQEEAIAHLTQLDPSDADQTPQPTVNTLVQPNTFGGHLEEQHPVGSNQQNTVNYVPSVLLKHTRNNFNENSKNRHEFQRQISFASTPSPHILSSPASHALRQSQVFLASTPKPIQHQLSPATVPQNQFRHQTHPPQQVYLQPSYQNIAQHQNVDLARQPIALPPHTPIQYRLVPAVPQTFVQQTPRPNIFKQEAPQLPQVPPVAQTYIQQTPRPPISNQQASQYHEAQLVLPVAQTFVKQAQEPHILSQNEAFLYRAQTKPANNPQFSTPASQGIIVGAQTPNHYKHVVYKSSVNYIRDENNAVSVENPALNGAVLSQAFLRGNEAPTTMDYAPLHRAPAQQQSVSYVNIIREPQNEVRIPAVKTNHVQYVSNVSPSENRVPASGRQEHYVVPQNQLNYDDFHQYAANYAFGYKIADHEHGNDYGHEEKKDGANTKGHYYVNLPDGRRQKVEYYVDDDGYHADVSYENIATHSRDFPHKR